MLTVYASFWVRQDAMDTKLSRALSLFLLPGQDPGPSLAKILEVDPGNPTAITGLAVLDEQGGHPDRAVARLEKAAAGGPNCLIDTALALHLSEQGRAQEAIQWASRACASAPDYPTAPAWLCTLYAQTGQDEQAVRTGRMALRLKPQDGGIYRDVGRALARLKRNEEAASYLASAVEFSPQDADAQYWLGVVLWELPGRQAEARDHMAAAVQLAPQNGEWKSKLREMQRALDTRR